MEWKAKLESGWRANRPANVRQLVETYGAGLEQHAANGHRNVSLFHCRTKGEEETLLTAFFWDHEECGSSETAPRVFDILSRFMDGLTREDVATVEIVFVHLQLDDRFPARDDSKTVTDSRIINQLQAFVQAAAESLGTEQAASWVSLRCTRPVTLREIGGVKRKIIHWSVERAERN